MWLRFTFLVVTGAGSDNAAAPGGSQAERQSYAAAEVLNQRDSLLDSVADLVRSLQRAKKRPTFSELPLNNANAGDPQLCPVVRSVADEKVYDFVFRQSHPLVIRNGAQTLINTLEEIAGGSFASVVQKSYSDLEVPVDVDRAHSDFNHFDVDRGVMMFPEVKYMKFEDFINAVRGGNGGLAVQQAESDFAGDLAFDLPAFVQWAEPSSDVHHSWICGVNKTSHAHYDNDDGMLIQVSGSKRVLLVDPTHFVSMSPTHAPHDFRENTISSDVGTSGISALPSWHFSGAREFPRKLAIECDVLRGDILLIPALWWHRVENVGVASEDNLNVAFNWWFFTDRLLRDQLWPFVQHNLFHVSRMWRRLPASGLFSPPNFGKQVWWPDPPLQVPAATCAEALWGSFPAWQLNGRYLSRSRPVVLRNVKKLPESMMKVALQAWEKAKVVLQLGNGSRIPSTISDLNIGDYTGPFSAVVDSSWALLLRTSNDSSGSDIWPFTTDTLSEKKRTDGEVWLARGNANVAARADEEFVLHWQVAGSAVAKLDPPLPGLRRRIENRNLQQPAQTLTCKLELGDVLVLPSYWWVSINAVGRTTAAAVQWRGAPHSLASQWWHAIRELLERAYQPSQDEGEPQYWGPKAVASTPLVVPHSQARCS